MAKTVGRFDYQILAPKKGDRPFNAIVHIVPKGIEAPMYCQVLWEGSFAGPGLEEGSGRSWSISRTT